MYDQYIRSVLFKVDSLRWIIIIKGSLAPGARTSLWLCQISAQKACDVPQWTCMVHRRDPQEAV